MRDEDEDMDEIKNSYQHFPPEAVLKYIEDYVTTDYRWSSNREWVNINSEFTSDDSYKMGFNLKENFVNDFKTDCMPLLKFICEHEDIEMMQAKELMFRISRNLGKSVTLFKKSDTPRTKISASPCPALVDLPDMKKFSNLSLVGEQALRYLNSRGLSEKHIKKYNLMYSDTKKCSKCHGAGYDDDEDQCPMCNGTGINFFYSRIIIPSYENGKLVYLQGRTIRDDDSLRYQNIKAPRLQVVYFSDLLPEKEDIYICEGPVDAMTLYDYPVTSLLNISISDPQVAKIIAKNPKRIIFIPDYDETIAKRNRINKAITDNMSKIIKETHGMIPVGIYHWYKMLEDQHKPIKKDINAAQITQVNENYVKFYDALRIKFIADFGKKDEYDN